MKIAFSLSTPVDNSEATWKKATKCNKNVFEKEPIDMSILRAFLLLCERLILLAVLMTFVSTSYHVVPLI